MEAPAFKRGIRRGGLQAARKKREIKFAALAAGPCSERSKETWETWRTDGTFPIWEVKSDAELDYFASVPVLHGCPPVTLC